MNLESHQIPATESPAVLENTNTPSHDSERLGHSDTDFEKNSTENVVPGPQSLTESGYITYPSSVEVTGSVILEGNTSLYQYYPSRNIRPSQELEETVCNDNQNLPESHGENDAAVHFVENVGDEEDQMSIDSLSEKDVIDSHLQGEPQEILEGIKNLNLFTEILHGREEPQEVSEGTENFNLFTEILHAGKKPQEISEGTENLNLFTEIVQASKKPQETSEGTENLNLFTEVSDAMKEPQEISEGTKNLNLFTEILHGSKEPQEISEGTENLNSFTEVSDASKEPQEISEGTENLNLFTEILHAGKKPQEISEDTENLNLFTEVSDAMKEPQEISEGTKNLNLFTEILHGSKEPQEISEGTENLNSFTEVSDASKEPQEISEGTENLNSFTEILHAGKKPQEISEGTENLNLFTEIVQASKKPQEISEGTENLNLFTEVSDSSKEPQEISEGTENGYCLDCSEPVTKLSRDVYHLIGDSSRTLAQRQSPGSDNGLSLIQGIHQANSVSPSAPVHSTFDLRRIFESQFHLHPHNYLMRALDEISLYSQEGCHGTLRTPLQPVLSTFGLNRHHNADHRLDVPLLSDRHSDALEPIPSPAQMVRIGEDSRSSAEVQRLEAPAGHLAGACHMSVEETDQVEIHDVDLDSHRAPSVENFQQLAFPQPNDIDVAIDLRAHKDARRENNLIFNNVARCFHCRVRVPKVQNIPCGHCTFCLICSFRFDPCPTCHCPVVRHEPFTF
ncbi:hypothetical protein Bpfe_029935 [Biomphalaria pfeifferi]|uniref:RING-type domain-containing protein n=1 Tax=Biomphalaria pfeifferi TaxID=112525 RepID=A0AAD8AQP1_BIOPF|nr:hypothetical protein Bpfe_029935 [Biomphalaria pfeifferi]